MIAKGSKGWLLSIFSLSVFFTILYKITNIIHTLFLALFFVFIFLFFLIFFRDPKRSGEISNNHMLSPADGRVIDIRGHKICIFMNITDIHVNRIPIAGEVISITHIPGANKPAFTKDSNNNERCITLVETSHGLIEITQIAGAFIRRIKSYISPGDSVSQNQRFGIILFGSRVDVTIPEGFDICVVRKQKVKAGETVIARVSNETGCEFLNEKSSREIKVHV